MRGYHQSRFRSLISTKLGRCRLCMRSALIGTLAGWLLAAGMYPWAHPIVFTLAAVIASAFTLLMISHVGAIIAREVATRRAFRRVRASGVPSRAANPSRRQFFGSTMTAATAALGVLLVDLGAGTRAAGADVARLFKFFFKFRLCNCYYSSNCSDTGRGTKCLWTWNGAECFHVPKPNTMINGVRICGESPGDPKCDGLCTGNLLRHIDWRQVLVFEVVDAADLYFRAYIEAGIRGGGPPDSTLIAEASRIRMPMNWHLEIIDAVHRAIDVTLGWDFMACQFAETCFGSIPRLNQTSAELLHAAREGLVNGLRDNDPEAVEGPIRNFWSRGMEFRPMHTGRCYQHGHPDAPETPVCQIAELKADLVLLLQGRARVIG